MGSPVILTLVGEQSKILFNLLILPLYFPIAFRMIGRGKTGLDTESFVESAHEASRKLRASIRENFLRQTVKTEHIPVVDICSSFCYQIGLAGH